MISGIYIYCNLINGKKYVGLSRNIFKRLKGHLKESQKAFPDMVIDKAIKKHGIENFYIIKMQYLKENLGYWEKYYIEFFNTFKSGYNMTTGGEKDFEVSEKTKKRISENHADISGEKNPMYGKTSAMKNRTHSAEARKKISMAHKGKMFTKETKKKISENHADFSGENHPMFGVRGKDNPNYGLIRSAETREKMGVAKVGENHPKSKITKEMVLDMREMFKDKSRRKEIYEKYENIITSGGINCILYNATWKHLL